MVACSVCWHIHVCGHTGVLHTRAGLRDARGNVSLWDGIREVPAGRRCVSGDCVYCVSCSVSFLFGNHLSHRKTTPERSGGAVGQWPGSGSHVGGSKGEERGGRVPLLTAGPRRVCRLLLRQQGAGSPAPPLPCWEKLGAAPGTPSSPAGGAGPRGPDVPSRKPEGSRLLRPQGAWVLLWSVCDLWGAGVSGARGWPARPVHRPPQKCPRELPAPFPRAVLRAQ